MRLLVASDSHRAAGNLLDIVELHLEDSDVLLFLGDGENDLENVRMLYPRLHILQVAGNCDWGSDLPAWGTAKLGGKTVLYTHGHPFHVSLVWQSWSRLPGRPTQTFACLVTPISR